MSIFAKLKERSLGAVIPKEWESLSATIYFKPLTVPQWQNIATIRKQIAQRLFVGSIDTGSIELTNYILDLLRWSWVEEDGSFVIDSDEKYSEVSEMDPSLIDELCMLALEANNFIKTQESKTQDLKKK